MSKFNPVLKRFSNQRKGSISTMMGLTFMMVTGATFAAIEVSEMHRVRAGVQQRLDDTLIYLGKSEHKTNPQEAGKAFFQGTIEASGLNVKNLNSDFKFNTQTGNIEGTATFGTDRLVTDLVIPDATQTVTSTATPRVRGRIEISMVLDTSGSMAWGFSANAKARYPNRRIDGLHEAARDMFNVIYENPYAKPAVAVVPYSSSVDITDVFAASSYKKYRYKAFGGGDLRDLKIVPALAEGMPGNLSSRHSVLNMNKHHVKVRDHEDGQIIWAAERHQGKNAADGNYNLSLSIPKRGHEIPIITQTDYSQRSRNVKLNGIGRGWLHSSYAMPTNGVLPLTYKEADVRKYVAALGPVGGTAGHIGAVWGAYMLTPDWHSMFRHPAGRPEKFSETTEKYFVFMTDGVFNLQKDPSMSQDDVYTYFQSVCKKMRDEGVRVFTVGLIIPTGVDKETGEIVPNASEQRTEDELTACAGETGHYFSANNRKQLIDAFRGVGRVAGELRISG